ncbi:MAG TPA: winged helix-turn-helix domain-containing protein [Croceibacterium sp.]
MLIDGRTVELDRNCAAILGVLLQEAGRDVAKERLLVAGWPDRIVHENSLAKAISRLRQALGSQSTALESAYGVGYRLKVDARRPAPPADEPVTAIEPEPAGPRRRLPALLAAAALLGAAGLVTTYFWTGHESGAEASFRTTPPVIADAPDAIGRLLWVDDHPQNNIYEERFFEERRIAVHTVTGSADALALLAMYDYAVVVSDMGRGEDRLAGIRLVEQMRARGDRTPFVIYTLRPDGEDAQQAQRRLVAEAGAQGVAVTPEEVRSVILNMFEQPQPRTAD